MKIAVVLHERDGNTDMTFIHAGLATPEPALSHRHGWTGAFDLLAAVSVELAQADQ